MSRHHRSEPPAESVTASEQYAPGTAWQKAWVLPEGSIAGSSECANSTPLVPIELEISPGRQTQTRRDPLTHLAERLGALGHACQPIGVDLQSLADLLGPIPGSEVE